MGLLAFSQIIKSHVNQVHGLWLICIVAVITIAPAQGGNTTFRVAFAQDDLGNPWRKKQAEELAKGFAKHRDIMFFVKNAGGSSSLQIRQIEDLGLQGVDLLITSPMDGPASTPVISKVFQSGIPVVLLTREITNDQYTTYISPDDLSIGRTAADILARSSGKKANIVMLEGVEHASTRIDRSRGFREGIAKHPEMKIVASVVANYNYLEALQAVENLVYTGLSFDAIFAQSDTMAEGARVALKKNKLEPSRFMIVGVDFNQDAKRAIINGEQLASLYYPTCAKEAIGVVRDILDGKTVAKNISVPSPVIDKNNLNSLDPVF